MSVMNPKMKEIVDKYRKIIAEYEEEKKINLAYYEHYKQKEVELMR